MKEEGYGSDLTDKEWSVLEPMIPGPSKLGRPARYSKRRVLDAIFYIVRGGIAWRMLPKDLPPWRICYHYFSKWKKEGLWERLHDQLRDYVRYRAGRKKLPLPRSSTRKACELLATAGFAAMNAGKKVKGRKRHLLVDALGLVLASVVHSASVQDRDGARLVLEELGSKHGWLRRIWADGGYRGKLVQWVSELPRHRRIELEIVARNDKAEGFEVLPQRWIVERTFAWLENSRRLSKDYERTTSSSQAMIHIAMTRLMTARLA